MQPPLSTVSHPLPKGNLQLSLPSALSFIRSRNSLTPSVGIILGSGLGEVANDLDKAMRIPYTTIPGFPRSTVPGHQGQLVFGELAGKVVAIMQGRFHFYEGHSQAEVAFPVRILREMGVGTLIVTAAVGALEKKIRPGDFVVVTDHMNWMGDNPLRGVHEDSMGSRFPDMVNAYDPALRKLALQVGKTLKLPVRQGIYVAARGPTYETPAEVRAFKKLGGHVVGMSVVPEVIVARQLGLKVLGITWVSNLAAGISKEPLTHDEVLHSGAKVAQRLKPYLKGILQLLP